MALWFRCFCRERAELRASEIAPASEAAAQEARLALQEVEAKALALSSSLASDSVMLFKTTPEEARESIARMREAKDALQSELEVGKKDNEASRL